MLEPITDKFDEFENYEDFTDLKTDQLLLEVWLKPKKVFSYLKKHDPDKNVQSLFWIAAFVSAFNRALQKNYLSFDSFGIGYLIGGIIGGGVITYLLYYAFAWILKLFGNAFLNGKATSRDYRLIVSWGNIPAILTVLTTVLLMVIYGGNALGSFEPQGYVDGIVFLIFGLIDIGLAIWSIVIVVAGIMQIQKFGVLKAIANLFLPFLIIVMVFVIVFVLGDLLAN